MYHVVKAPPPGAPNPGLYVSPRDFAGQVGWLARHGYRAVTLRRVFDYTRALAVLRARSWPGVLNREVHNTTVSWGLRLGRARALLRAGWELDAHTLTHPDLTLVAEARLREEVAGSRKALRPAYGAPVDFFSYPAGRYEAWVIAAVQVADYLGATTTRHGLARPADLYTLARVRVDARDGVAGLAPKPTSTEGTRP